MSSRMSPTPVRLGAAISMTSTWRARAIPAPRGATPPGARGALRAAPAGRGRRPAAAVRPDAVQRAGDDARRGGLADAAHAGEDEAVRQAAAVDGVGEGAHQGFLADQV